MRDYTSELIGALKGIIKVKDKINALRKQRVQIYMRDRCHPDLYQADTIGYLNALEIAKQLNRAYDDLMTQFDGSKITYWDKDSSSEREYTWKYTAKKKQTESEILSVFIAGLRYLLSQDKPLADMDQYLRNSGTWIYIAIPRTSPVITLKTEKTDILFSWCKDQARYGWGPSIRKGKTRSASGLGRQVDSIFAATYTVQDACNIQ